MRRSTFSRNPGLEPAKRQSMESTKAAMAQSRGKTARKRILVDVEVCRKVRQGWCSGLQVSLCAMYNVWLNESHRRLQQRAGGGK